MKRSKPRHQCIQCNLNVSAKGSRRCPACQVDRALVSAYYEQNGTARYGMWAR